MDRRVDKSANSGLSPWCWLCALGAPTMLGHRLPMRGVSVWWEKRFDRSDDSRLKSLTLTGFSGTSFVEFMPALDVRSAALNLLDTPISSNSPRLRPADLSNLSAQPLRMPTCSVSHPPHCQHFRLPCCLTLEAQRSERVECSYLVVKPLMSWWGATALYGNNWRLGAPSLLNAGHDCGTSRSSEHALERARARYEPINASMPLSVTTSHRRSEYTRGHQRGSQHSF